MNVKALFLVFCFLNIHIMTMAQGDSILISNEWQMGKFHQMEPTGLAKIKKEHPFQLNDHPDEPFPNFHAEDNSINSFLNGESSTTSLKTNGVTLHIGNEFEANHLYGSIPADPAMAISNGGRIVSIDNATIAYFKETGDTIVKYGLPLANWYQDSTMDRGPFDPRVIYDSYTDRFISVLLYLSDDYTESRVLVSFSQAFGPDSISWNHYQIHCDSIYTEANEAMYWLDYPNIAINKNELFITLSVFDHDSINNSDTKEKTLLLQIEKAPGYAGAANINCKEWKNVLNADGNSSGTFVPVGEALQSASYGPGCYMVSNYSQNSTNFFWYELTGDINNAGAQIISHLIASSFFYSHPSYATQMGGNGGDRIKFGDCRIRSGFYQNGKLHFVFHRSDNGWGEIVYAKITLANNMFEANTWGGDEESLNSFYPSIAPYGKDSTEENSVITFSRSGPTIFPEVCVINYDSAWSPAVTVVKTGLGVIDQQIDLVAPWDTLERIGDYSDIQRRYSDPQNACWLIGSYASGPVANHFGVTDGIKLWIAEIGDSAIVSIPKPVSVSKFQMFPNPVFNGEQALNFHLNSSRDHGNIQIMNANGIEVLNTKFRGPSFSIQIPDLAAGVYFITLNSKQKRYASQKLLILP